MIDIAEELDLCGTEDELRGLIKRLGEEREEVVDRLRETADLMADLGRIHPTPQAKQQWIGRIVAG